MRMVRTGAALAVLAGLAAAGEIQWAKDYDAARTRSIEEGKLLYLFFTADW